MLSRCPAWRQGCREDGTVRAVSEEVSTRPPKPQLASPLICCVWVVRLGPQHGFHSPGRFCVHGDTCLPMRGSLTVLSRGGAPPRLRLGEYSRTVMWGGAGRWRCAPRVAQSFGACSSVQERSVLPPACVLSTCGQGGRGRWHLPVELAASRAENSRTVTTGSVSYEGGQQEWRPLRGVGI